MKIAIIGVENEEIVARIESVSAALGLHVGLIGAKASWSDLEEVGGDWEILILGPGLIAEELPGRMAKLLEDHPSGLVIALEKAGGAVNSRDVLEAGVFAILPSEPTYDALHLSINRAARFLARNARQTEQEKRRLITQLAASVNHEINNPLTGLMGTAELILLENKSLPEKLERDMKNIITQARRIQTITLRLRHLDHLRTIPYEGNEAMIDLAGETEPPTEQAGARHGESGFFEAPTILIVDDNQLIIDLIGRFLGDRFDVDNASSSSDALSKLQYRDFDLVLVDLVMPEMDGLDLLRAIHRMKPGQRVLMTTGYHTDERLERAIAEGAIGWIKKPFDFDELEARFWDAVKDDGKREGNGSPVPGDSIHGGV